MTRAVAVPRWLLALLLFMSIVGAWNTGLLDVVMAHCSAPQIIHVSK